MNIADTLARSIVTDASDAIIATDREGVICLWNAGAERIFGYTASEAVGRSLDIIIPEGLRERHWRGFRHVMDTGDSHYGAGDLLSVPGIRKNGQRVSLEFSIVALKDAQGEIAGLAAIMRDVTKRFEEVRSLKAELAAAKGGERR
ncbi:hypothetical protein CF70_034955 [Cupriavidus sp. SK-3]|uniref:PAS domain-containing protein n=1 Tax=Cupriavidus sp. SK-3 TaxID=1470558 RepID=UPI0004477936|nr:PAS domain S-box protein [Cupriavidus sp. SK-3]KDP87711.1 hypothetical protein CF70_034955 [Cupriavidus sp. SK-3]